MTDGVDDGDFRLVPFSFGFLKLLNMKIKD